MKSIEAMLDQLLKIEKELEQLGSAFSDVYKEYSGFEFSEQVMLAEDKLDNLILAATHEVATEIGFYRQSIRDLAKYILFRKEYRDFTDEELKSIIDNQFLTTQEKLNLQAKSNNKIIDDLKQIKYKWNELFDNKSYHKIKSELKILL